METLQAQMAQSAEAKKADVEYSKRAAQSIGQSGMREQVHARGLNTLYTFKTTRILPLEVCTGQTATLQLLPAAYHCSQSGADFKKTSYLYANTSHLTCQQDRLYENEL